MGLDLGVDRQHMPMDMLSPKDIPRRVDSDFTPPVDWKTSDASIQGADVIEMSADAEPPLQEQSA